jgi:hypothetical protein
MKAIILLLFAVAITLGAGCSSPEEAAPPNALTIQTPSQKAAAPGNSEAKMPALSQDKELSINPNGSMATPGSKLGGR